MKISINLNLDEMNNLMMKLIPAAYIPVEGMEVLNCDTVGYPVKGFKIVIGDKNKKEDDSDE